MGLRHLPGVEGVEMESNTAVIAGPDLDDLVEEKPIDDIFSDVDEDEDDANDPLLTVDPVMIDDIAQTVADVIIKNIDNLDELPVERVSFFKEEIIDAIAFALEESCDFSRDSFEMWYHANVDVRY